MYVPMSALVHIQFKHVWWATRNCIATDMKWCFLWVQKLCRKCKVEEQLVT